MPLDAETSLLVAREVGIYLGALCVVIIFCVFVYDLLTEGKDD